MTRHRSLAETLLRRPRAGEAERGSIALLMLVIVSTTAFGAIMMTTIISQSRSTRYDLSRVHALHAAQTGIDLTVGAIRSAVSSAGSSGSAASGPVGDAGLLPCGPWSGSANGAGSATFYSTVTFYVTNPSNGAAAAMTCTTAGPYIGSGSTLTRTPRYALITSTGSEAVGATTERRTLKTTYIFQTNDVNIAGGQIQIFPASATPYCMDAGSAAPSAGTSVTIAVCSTSSPPPGQQIFAYRSDLSIELVSSTESSATPTGLCLDTRPKAHAATGDVIVLNTCAVPDSVLCPSGTTPTSYAQANPGKTCQISPYNQQWSVDDNAHLRGALGDQSSTDGYCIDVESQAPAQPVILATCAGSTTDTKQTWVPAPTAGAGMAGAGNNQLVNYKQFATCLDVTGQNVNASYLILYTCKQNPNPANVAWNQKFAQSNTGVAPTSTLLTVTASGTRYCLTSPRTIGGYPVLSLTCPSSVAAAGSNSPYVWTVSTLFSDATGLSPLAYADKYTIRDASGLCLSPGPNSDLLNGQYYKAVVSTCDGSTGQKWNADASLDASRRTDTFEYPQPLTPPGG